MNIPDHPEKVHNFRMLPLSKFTLHFPVCVLIQFLSSPCSYKEWAVPCSAPVYMPQPTCQICQIILSLKWSKDNSRHVISWTVRAHFHCPACPIKFLISILLTVMGWWNKKNWLGTEAGKKSHCYIPGCDKRTAKNSLNRWDLLKQFSWNFYCW